MDIVTVKNNKVYTKYKSFVKKWEKQFTAKYSRMPSKLDIKEAPSKVRYAYKQYFHMKSAALEESILDCPIDDESVAGSPEFPTLSDSMFDATSPNSDFHVENLPTTTQIVELLSTAKKYSDKELPDTDVCDKKSKLDAKLSDKVSKKLFQKSKFSLRNPRKSNSFKLFQNKCMNQDASVTYVDEKHLSVVNSQIPEGSLQAPVSMTYKINDLGPNSPPAVENLPALYNDNVDRLTSVRQINLGWLERAAAENFEPLHSSSTESHNVNKYGITNINSIAVDKFQIDHVENTNTRIDDVASKFQVDYVENSESEIDDIATQTLKPALKKRKIHDETTNATNIKVSIPENQIDGLTNVADAEKDIRINTAVVDKSEDNKKKKRERRKSKPIKRTVTKENTSKQNDVEDISEPPNIEDFISIGAVKHLTPRYDKESNLFMAMIAKNEINVNSNKRILSAAEKLEQKVKSGTLNENFVRINIKKKVFVRGKKSFNYSKFKKQQWKDKKALAYEMEFPEGGKVSCFKCGHHGHMARYCTAQRGESLLPLDACPADETPTLADMEIKINAEPEDKEKNKIETLSQFACSAIPESFLELLSQSSKQSNEQADEVLPIYPNYHGETPKEVQECLQMFKHRTFRPGQEQAIMRILSGRSTLLILSTGSGKSLCYQLPAYIYSKYYKCVTLVISPLVSLMDDQVLSMPDFLRAGCLHTNQTATQRQKILECLKDGQLNILLISPEALISGDRNSGIGSLFKNLPPIAFACIDEAHCVSQWSHNFRPSYLMICRVLREKLKVNCILGLTATASNPTITSIIDHINVPDGSSGVITNPALPRNLILSVSYEKDKDRSMITLLGSEPFSSYDSIIVYCIRRDECERVAGMLRSSLQEPGVMSTKRSRKRIQMSYFAEAYHAGLSAAQRRKIQDHFMNGSLKIIVATVAFGMGINKSNIRCIIHYNMPKNFESYVQEVGRAGRDGKMAHCHVFMNRSHDDKNELLKHIHSNTIDRHVIRKLLHKVFVPCDCNKNFSKSGHPENRCKGHEVAFSIDDTVEELDIASENIATLLCYLELHPKKYIQVLNNCYTMCKIYSYGGPQKLLDAAKSCPPLAMAYTLGAKRDEAITKASALDFPIIDVAAAIGWESGIVKYHVKNLEWIKENGRSKRSTIKVEFHTLGLRVRAPGDLTASEMDEMLDSLHDRVQTQERTMLYQLEEINKAFSKVAKNCVSELFTSESNLLEEQSNKLKNIIRDYFERDNVMNTDIDIEPRPLNEERAIGDIKALISAYKDCTFTGRAIARILQGIPSPNYPALVWGRCKFWRSHIHEDFHGLTRLATQQLIAMR